MVDGVAVEHDQLKGAGQLEDPLDLLLHLAETIGATAGAVHGPLRGIVHDGSFRQRDVGHHTCDDNATLEPVL